MTDIARYILRSALDFVTQREIPGNQGWVDEKFEELMKLTGWKQGEAWCAYFVELILITAGLNEHAEILSGSAVQTWKNCKKSSLFATFENPLIGDIVIWQNYRDGKATWSGHAGIVVGLGKGLIITVEGNTNTDGVREGEEVALKIRDPKYKTDNGLNVLGFIRPVL